MFACWYICTYVKCDNSASPLPVCISPVQYQADYGDIIKTALTHCLRYSVAQTSYEWSHVLVEALKSEYRQLMEERDGEMTVDFTSAAWGDLRVWEYLDTGACSFSGIVGGQLNSY